MDKSRLEILLVEDNPADVRLIGYALEESQATQHLNVALDGEEALDFLFRRGAHINAPRVDLVLLDLNLPIMSGAAGGTRPCGHCFASGDHPQFLECAQRRATGL